ncbi:hypothetical protein CsSME_00014141 [Camellia sinensis var. sinensis]
MNIVKGVADLIRRTSTGHSAESGSGSSTERFSPPTPKIRFSVIEIHRCVGCSGCRSGRNGAVTADREKREDKERKWRSKR